jgi:hypothetical protein
MRGMKKSDKAELVKNYTALCILFHAYTIEMNQPQFFKQVPLTRSSSLLHASIVPSTTRIKRRIKDNNNAKPLPLT